MCDVKRILCPLNVSKTCFNLKNRNLEICDTCVDNNGSERKGKHAYKDGRKKA